MTEKQYSKYKEYLSSLGSKPGLECMEALLKKLGDPQDELLFIHVAGTNGKGSVCAFLTSILERAGLKTGRYTSPAVFDERERFTAGGRMIGKSTMLRLMDRIKEASSQLVSEGMRHPTLFETETALAFLFFASKKCDIVVLECGMGGLLDATNVIKNALLEVITSVSIDHEAFLGKGLSAIASQKAGIIKQGSTVVSAPQHPEVRKVLEAACAEKSARLVTLSDEDISDVRTGRGRQSFVFSDKLRLTTTLIGSYQIYNAALAAATAFELPRALDGYTGSERLKTERVAALIKKGVDKNAVKEGILAAEWPGRFQIIMNKPCFVIDGAHNRDGATQFARSLDMYFQGKRIIYIMGVFADKDSGGIINETIGRAEHVICVSLPDKSRTMDALELAGRIREEFQNVTAADSIEEAVEMALLLAGEDGVVAAFGSLSFLGRIKDAAGCMKAGS